VPSHNLLFRSSEVPSITTLSLSRIRALLNSALQRPYRVDNLRTLANWWHEDTLEGYGVKQKWLLAYSLAEWWKTLNTDIRTNIYLRVVATDVKIYVKKTSSAMERNEGNARILALKAHPGLCIKGQVYDVM
jgi:hypothetical protein